MPETAGYAGVNNKGIAGYALKSGYGFCEPRTCLSRAVAGANAVVLTFLLPQGEERDEGRNRV